MHILYLLAFPLLLMVGRLAAQNKQMISQKSILVEPVGKSVVEYGYGNEIPTFIKPQALEALSKFPELENTKIIFKESNIKTTLNVRPTMNSVLFKSKQKRTYIVRINRNKAAGGILVDEVPDTALVGLLGHEFTHIVDYQQLSALGLIKRGINYYHKPSKRRYEKMIDSLTVVRGFGLPLFHWSDFVLNQSEASESYKQYKRKYYLQPLEIKSMISRLPHYEGK